MKFVRWEQDRRAAVGGIAGVGTAGRTPSYRPNRGQGLATEGTKCTERINPNPTSQEITEETKPSLGFISPFLPLPRCWLLPARDQSPDPCRGWPPVKGSVRFCAFCAF